MNEIRNKYLFAAMASFVVFPFCLAQETGRSTIDLGAQHMFKDRSNGQNLTKLESLLRKAKTEIAKENWKDAAGFLREALKEGKSDVNLYLTYAEFHYARKEYPAVEKALLKAIELDPCSSQAHFQYSRILTIKGDVDKALVEANLAAELAAENEWIIWAWKSKLHDEAGSKDIARDAINKAVQALIDEIKRVEGIIHRFENVGEIARLVEEGNVVSGLGATNTEVDVAYYETELRDAPEDWELYLKGLRTKLDSLKVQQLQLKP